MGSSIVPTIYGCNGCGCRWTGAELCWMCGRPGAEVSTNDARMTSKEGAYAIHPDDARHYVLHGPILTNDPCGSGPL